MDPDVPLIVPQVNSQDIKKLKKNIIANPNCSTAQLVIVLKPLHEVFKIKRVVISTYQSTSGAGKKPMDELIEQTKDILENKKISINNFTKQIAFNAIPHIDEFSNDGYTKEELKMINETKNIKFVRSGPDSIRSSSKCRADPSILGSIALTATPCMQKEFSVRANSTKFLSIIRLQGNSNICTSKLGLFNY